MIDHFKGILMYRRSKFDHTTSSLQHILYLYYLPLLYQEIFIPGYLQIFIDCIDDVPHKNIISHYKMFFYH